METKAALLAAKLQKQLHPVYLVWGNEPLQRTESIDAIRQRAREQGYTERTVLSPEGTGFDWGQLSMAAANLSMFSSQHLIELRLPGLPGQQGARVLTAHAAKPPTDVLLLVLMPILLDTRTRKTAWYKALSGCGLSVAARTIPATELPDWILQRGQRKGLKLDPAAATFIAERTEGNLLAAHQELERLTLLNIAEITPEQLMREVADSARFNVFDMLEAALAGRLRRAIHMLNGLQQEGTDPMAVYGATIWEIRRLCKLWQGDQIPDAATLGRNNIWGTRRNAVHHALKRGPGFAHQLLASALCVERTLKSTDREEGWRALHWLLLKLCGQQVPPGALHPNRNR